MGIGSDIEEVVSSLAGNVGEGANEGFCRLPVGVIALESPGMVECHATLPVPAGESLGRDFLLGRLGVTAETAAEAVVLD